jgi:uncharacterized protein YjeT (DUF2065 family)
MFEKTRLSLVYVAVYLSISGLGFFLVPQLAVHLLFSDGRYDSTFIRVSGAFLIVLAIFVIQVIRHRVTVLYTTLMAVRIFLLAVWLSLYFLTKDPMFLVFFAIVGLGEILSITGFVLDGKNQGS